MRYGLSETDIKKINNVFSVHTTIQKVILYGSRSRGDYKTYSDIDLALEGTDLNLNLLGKMVFYGTGQNWSSPSRW
jgi:predicted nucleotidyltransferase